MLEFPPTVPDVIMQALNREFPGSSVLHRIHRWIHMHYVGPSKIRDYITTLILHDPNIHRDEKGNYHSDSQVNADTLFFELLGQKDPAIVQQRIVEEHSRARDRWFKARRSSVIALAI